MTVKEVKKDKKHLCRLDFTDGSTVFLDIDVYNDSPIKAGDEISEEELLKFRYKSDYERAKQRALWYLDRKAYTERALFDKLKTAGFGEKASAAVIARFKELSLIDDESFARDFAERATDADMSKREIYQKLYIKGVDSETIKAVLDGIDSDEYEKVKNLIDKKYKNKLYDEQNVSRVYAALIRKGFSYGVVRDALKDYSEELLLKSED